MNEKIERFFSSNKPFDTLLIVNPAITELDNLADELVSRYDLPRFSLNIELSQLLISEPRQAYANVSFDWLTNRANEIVGLILFSNIDILFEPSLKIDPLALFKQIGRYKQIIVLWPGNFSNNSLTYATPDHAHFKRWVNPGVEIIQL